MNCTLLWEITWLNNWYHHTFCQINVDSLHKNGWFKGTERKQSWNLFVVWFKNKGLLCSHFNDRDLTFRGTDWNGYFTDRYEKGRGGGYSLVWPARGCAAGQGMGFELSVLNRVYKFKRVCSNCKQGIACTIDLYDLLDEICVLQVYKERNFNLLYCNCQWIMALNKTVCILSFVLNRVI